MPHQEVDQGSDVAFCNQVTPVTVYDDKCILDLSVASRGRSYFWQLGGLIAWRCCIVITNSITLQV